MVCEYESKSKESHQVEYEYEPREYEEVSDGFIISGFNKFNLSF